MRLPRMTMRLAHLRFSVGDLMVVICGFGMLLSLSPHIYWFYPMVAGSLLGYALHRRLFGKGVLGGVVGGWGASAVVAALAYIGSIDRGGPVQWAMRHSPAIEIGILSVIGTFTGLFIGVCLWLVATAPQLRNRGETHSARSHDMPSSPPLDCSERVSVGASDEP